MLWDVILSLLCISDSRLRKLQDVVLVEGKERRLMGERHGLQVVDVVFQLAQVDPNQSECLAEVVQNRVCSSVYKHGIKTRR